MPGNTIKQAVVPYRSGGQQVGVPLVAHEQSNADNQQAAKHGMPVATATAFIQNMGATVGALNGMNAHGLVKAGNRYWAVFTARDSAQHPGVVLWYSDDNGGTWTKHSQLDSSTGDQRPSIAVDDEVSPTHLFICWAAGNAVDLPLKFAHITTNIASGSPGAATATTIDAGGAGVGIYQPCLFVTNTGTNPRVWIIALKQTAATPIYEYRLWYVGVASTDSAGNWTSINNVGSFSSGTITNKAQTGTAWKSGGADKALLILLSSPSPDKFHVYSFDPTVTTPAVGAAVASNVMGISSGTYDWLSNACPVLVNGAVDDYLVCVRFDGTANTLTAYKSTDAVTWTALAGFTGISGNRSQISSDGLDYYLTYPNGTNTPAVMRIGYVNTSDDSVTIGDYADIAIAAWWSAPRKFTGIAPFTMRAASSGANTMIRAGFITSAARAPAGAAVSGGAITVMVAGGTRTTVYAKSGGAVSTSIGGGTRATLIAKSSGATTIMVGGGSRAIRYPRSGGGITVMNGGGTRAIGFARSGGGVTPMIAGGTRATRAGKSGGAVTIMVGGGTRATRAAKSSGAITVMNGGGVRTTRIAKSSGAIDPMVGGGTGISATIIAKSGGAIDPMVAGGVRATRAARSNGAVSPSVGGGLRATRAQKANGGLTAGVGGGVRAARFAKASGAVTTMAGGGAPGIRYAKSGGAIMQMVGGGAVSVTSTSKTGGAITVMRGGGDVATSSHTSKTGGARSTMVGGGSVARLVLVIGDDNWLISAGDDPGRLLSAANAPNNSLVSAADKEIKLTKAGW